jgi:hypothetical protein
MQLPEDSPHTRREQYLMAIPVDLLSRSEAATKKLLEIRLRYYLRSFLLPLVEEAASRGLTVEEWAREFVATFEGPLPTVFDARPRSSGGRQQPA